VRSCFRSTIVSVPSKLPFTRGAQQNTLTTKRLQLVGEFTLHGTTNNLTLVADTAKVNGYTRIYGNFSILQSDYGITPFRKALGVVGVADRLTIWGELWIAEQQAAQPGVQR
jgi:hypothetical protein